jgi:hypothetical protein
MPRPRKPAELLELTGGYRPDRHHQRRAAPKSEHPIGEPPGHLAPDEAAAWREYVSNAPAGVLTSYDRWVLEMVACLVARSRREGLTGAELGLLRGFLTELGATPASCGRVLATVPAEAPAGNPWDVAAPGRA